MRMVGDMMGLLLYLQVDDVYPIADIWSTLRFRSYDVYTFPGGPTVEKHASYVTGLQRIQQLIPQIPKDSPLRSYPTQKKVTEWVRDRAMESFGTLGNLSVAHRAAYVELLGVDSLLDHTHLAAKGKEEKRKSLKRQRSTENKHTTVAPGPEASCSKQKKKKKKTVTVKNVKQKKVEEIGGLALQVPAFADDCHIQ
jgi:hypothetical protein